MQVFEHQHQRHVRAQDLKRLGQLTQHPGGRRPLHVALEVLQLGLAEHPEQLPQPQRGIAPQHRHHGRLPGPAAELPQGLQEGEVRFALAKVLDALAARDPHPTARVQAGQHHLHHSRLANASFVTEQDALADALGGPLDVLVDGLDFGPAADEGASRQRGRDLPGVAQEKAIALSADRGEIARRRRRIAQGLANLVYTHAQHGIGDVGAGPDVLAHLGFGHQAAGMGHEIAQQRQGLGPQGNGLLSLPQATLRFIQMEWPKRAVLLLRHRRSFHFSVNVLCPPQCHSESQVAPCGSSPAMAARSLFVPQATLRLTTPGSHRAFWSPGRPRPPLSCQAIGPLWCRFAPRLRTPHRPGKAASSLGHRARCRAPEEELMFLTRVLSEGLEPSWAC